MSRVANSRRGINRAVVVGAGIGGMCTARALASRFREVLLVDRDNLPQRPSARAGAPQSSHVHSLLVRGKRDLTALFPDLKARLHREGALDLDLWQDFAILRRSGWAPREDAPERMLFASRPLLEWAIREELALQPGVRFMPASRVTGVLWSGASDVAGVQLSNDELEADLVVDATGRNSQFLPWFERHGLGRPHTNLVDPRAGYASRWFAAPRHGDWPADWWWKGIWIYSAPPRYPYTGILFPIEGHQWIVTLIGTNGVMPPTDEEGFTQALSQLRSPILAEAVSRAKPTSKVFGYRSLANVQLHYETWPRLPGGWLAVGDAVCALNPIYGQGMSCAVSSARLLQSWLKAKSPETRRFFQAQARANSRAWALSAGADSKALALAGNSLTGSAKWVSGYLEALLAASQHSRALRVRFIEVINLLRAPSSLFHPQIAARVAYHSLRHRAAASSAERWHDSRPDVLAGAH